ncbi:MAG: hypothetical protein ACREK5_02450 [Gemmatimonadota bacterium]
MSRRFAPLWPGLILVALFASAPSRAQEVSRSRDLPPDETRDGKDLGGIDSTSALGMNGIPNEVLELVARLVAEPDHDPATLERIIGVPLREAKTEGNPQHVVYEGRPEDRPWLSRVELRRARATASSLLVLNLDQEVCGSTHHVLAEYGEPDDLIPPFPHGGPRVTYYRYDREDGHLAFGFGSTDQGSCLNSVILDRLRGHCLESVEIRSNTQGHFGEDVHIGVGNIWVAEYENERGAIEHGLSAAVTVVRDRPAENLRLRVGPGSRFLVGGEEFRVLEVHRGGVRLCRLGVTTGR